jgi:hypothetical protein
MEAFRGVFGRRGGFVQHPFGTIKQWMNQGACCLIYSPASLRLLQVYALGPHAERYI